MMTVEQFAKMMDNDELLGNMLYVEFVSLDPNSIVVFTPEQAVLSPYYSENRIFTYHMIGVGYVGGLNSSGEQCDYFIIIVKPSGEVKTAYPIQ